MSAPDRELLRRLELALEQAEIDPGDLVEEAWLEARAEVRDTLRRLMVRDLLRRSTGVLAADPAPAAGPSVDPDASDPATGTYLFGIWDGTRQLPGELPSLPGSGPLRLVEVDGLAAIAADVEVARFASLREPGPDTLDVLAEVAQAHDTILARLAEEGPVLPLRLGTVLTGDDAVEAVLADHADDLGSELDRVRGRREWAVTVQYLGGEGADGSQTPEATTTRATGREYLQARQEALEAKRRRRQEREGLATSIHDALARRAVAAERIDSRPLEQAAPPLLHGVYLVEDDGLEAFDSTVAELSDEHPDAMIDVSGPWPPYHFTTVRLDDAASAT